MNTQAVGQFDVSDDASNFNRIAFLINQFLNLRATATLVQVVSCSNSGALSPIGTVTVHPLVQLIDGAGYASAHGNIVNVPYLRVQGGTNAIICDPAPGDIGLAVFCDQDISGVKASGGEATPGSFRRNDMGDGIYCLTVLSASAPTQYWRFDANGITAGDASGNSIVTNSNGITLNGLVIDRSGNLTTPGTVIAGNGGADQVGLQTHEHPTAGTGAPSPPTPGT